MTNKKGTKRALLMSVLAMLMCVTMLVGSTFAWFTDSVTSAGNKIVAGKLDVQLLMKTSAEGDYVDISNATAPIFGNGSIAQDNNAETLWEPGKTQVAYLAIKNNGNLDLKYTVGLNVVNVKNDLYEVMEYAIVPDAQYGSVTSWTSGNSVVIGTQSVSGDVELKKGEIHYFALAIHMDEEAGNKYQEGEVDFDLTVLATQLASESDSFNNQYDKDAEYAVSVSTAAELANALAEGGNVVLANDIEVDECLDILNQNVTLDLNGKKITVADGDSVEYIFDIENNEDGEKTVTIKNGTIEAGESAVQRTIYAYSRNDAVEGEKLVLNLENVTVKNTRTDGIKNVVHAQRNVTVNVKSGTVLESNGTYGTVEMGYGAVMNVYEGATIKHTSGTSTTALNAALTAGMNGGVINVYGGTVISDVYSVYALPTGGTINLEGGNYTGNVMAHDAGVVNISGGTYNGDLETNKGTMSVTGGTFATDPSTYVADGYAATKNADNAWTIAAK